MRLIIIFFLSLFSFSSFAQQKELYDPKADAAADIAAAVKQARSEKKHVFLQIGGNWCGWCHLFNKYVTTNDSIKTVMDKNYVTVHVNYSEGHENRELMASLGYPQRFGFPVFVILDGNGTRIHTQNSVYLEKGKGYNTEHVVEFLNNWSYVSLDPAKYITPASPAVNQ